MRKLLSLLIAGAFTLTLGACSEQPTTPDAGASVHDAAILNATADIDAVDTEAAALNGFKKGDDVGTINVTDDRARETLTVEGTASGLYENAVYVSLFYDVESTVTGPEACEPALGIDDEFDQDKVLSLAQMEIGPGDPALSPWSVSGDGSAILGPVKMTLADKKYIKMERIGTVSIRDARVDGPLGPGTGPDAVVGCGTVIVN